MVCEFLPQSLKRKLLEIATVEDLVGAGFSKRGAYNAKKAEVISDERCEKLIHVMGDRALPVIREAFSWFKEELQELGLPEATGQSAGITVKELKEAVEEAVKKAMKEYFEAYFGKPKTEADLDRVYYQICDDSGLTTIEHLRKQLGMTEEQFMARFRDYIIQNYELHSGGKEGILINGAMHGVIRRKDFDPMRKRMYL